MAAYESVLSKEHDFENAAFSEPLIERIEDLEVWQTVFSNSSIQTLLQYFTQTLDGGTYYSLSDSISVFAIPTFQEYIDSLVHIQTLGPYDYQKFIQSMNDAVFRKNMEEKYKKVILQDQTKNHIIYIVKLYLLSQTYSRYFTENEASYLEETINMIPYFEHLSEKGWDIDALESYKDKGTMGYNKELEACIIIRNMLLR
jgi:hypothetical protein